MLAFAGYLFYLERASVLLSFTFAKLVLFSYIFKSYTLLRTGLLYLLAILTDTHLVNNIDIEPQ